MTRPDRLLRLDAVKNMTGMGTTSVYSAISRLGFPKPVKLGRISAWSEAEVAAWIERVKAERDAA